MVVVNEMKRRNLVPDKVQTTLVKMVSGGGGSE
jgi:hypothetical protein